MKTYFQRVFGFKPVIPEVSVQKQAEKQLTKALAPPKKENFDKFKESLLNTDATAPFSNVSNEEVHKFLKDFNVWWPEFKRIFHSPIGKDDARNTSLPKEMIDDYNRMTTVLEPLHEDIVFMIAKGILSISKNQESITKELNMSDKGPKSLDTWFGCAVLESAFVFCTFLMDKNFDTMSYGFKDTKVIGNLPKGNSTQSILKLAALKRIYDIFSTSLNQSMGFLNGKYTDVIFKNMGKDLGKD